MIGLRKCFELILIIAVVFVACETVTNEASGISPAKGVVSQIRIAPGKLVSVGTVDKRYQSYNVEMLEVTGGKFWRPYSPELEVLLKQPAPKTVNASGDTPAGMNPALYQYRPPIDLRNNRLRKLAKALGPAYVRVSGTWANSTYFPATDKAPIKAPDGFLGVLTRNQWKGLVEFANAVDAKIVTSFATSAGTRDQNGVWTTDQAKRLLDYTRSLGSRISAGEFMNEPNLAAMGGAPPGYDAVAYGRDFKIFHAFAKQLVPEMLILHPGAVGETTGSWGVAQGYGSTILLKTRDLLAASGLPSANMNIDSFAYHHYGSVSKRCAATGHQTTAEEALSEQWLARTDETLAFYKMLRDEFMPAKPFWNTETADTACGGNPWGGSFLDTFRYLDQLGRLAKQDVQVVVHNTLAASDYSLVDENTFAPKPTYWAAFLWRQLMGTCVLDSGAPIKEGQHIYAHCLREKPGGVALLVINNDRSMPLTLTIPILSQRYTLSSQDLQSKTVNLNGEPLKLGANDSLPSLTGHTIQPGNIDFAPATITFLAIPEAANEACRQ